MRRTFAFSINILFIFIYSAANISAQDTVDIPLKIKAGIDISGPALYFADKNILNLEGYVSADLNEKRSLIFGAGYLDYKYSQYNYNYLNKGFFARTGIDFNLLKPEKAMGIYWAGIGLRYGISIFNSEVTNFQKENYWGTVSSSVARQTNWGHFIEVSPGVRAEVFKNFSIGWTISLRKLIYTGTGKDLRPIYFPGYGNGNKSVTTGFSYFFTWNFPYKRIKVIIKEEVPEETEESVDSGTLQQPSEIRR